MTRRERYLRYWFSLDVPGMRQVRKRNRAWSGRDWMSGLIVAKLKGDQHLRNFWASVDRRKK